MFPTRALLAGLTSLLFLVVTLSSVNENVHAQESESASIDITGKYQSEGQGYSGSATISKVGETYHLRWKLGARTYNGVAIRQGNILASSWATNGSGAGIVLYQVHPGPKLIGKYTDFPGDGIIRAETLTFLEPLPTLPPQRIWREGETALVNSSQDDFWYPATITKVDGKRYLVRYEDKSQEWTVAARMVIEDIVAGDRVFANWRDRGRYYPGRVSKREGRNIHILYDDGDKETTTIAFVRVLRPRDQ